MMIKIQQGREGINPNGGNILIGALLQLKAWDKIGKMQTQRIKHGEVSHSDILKIAVALLAQGRTDFEAIDLYRNDPLFKEALSLETIPSLGTLRQRLNDLGLCNNGQTLIDDCFVELLSKVEDFGKIQTEHAQYIPLDIDVSVMLKPNCKKEGVSWTYHNENGYAPIFCHIGTYGYMLANELRNGSQHSAKGAVEFVQRCILSHRQPVVLENEAIFMGVEVPERLTDADGQAFLIPELEVSAWWTNLPESEVVCIKLYCEHATSEQFHSEPKSDMGIERLPSGKFATNALILHLAALAYNCLRRIGQESLVLKDILPIKIDVSHRRLRSVLQDLIYIGCKFTRHANAVIVKFSRNYPWFNCFKEIYSGC